MLVIHAEGVMIQIFDFLLLNPNHKSIEECHKKTGIARTTLLGWRKQVQIDPCWRPWKKRTNINKMILSSFEEFGIVDEITM